MRTRHFLILFALLASVSSCIMIFDCIDGNGIMRTEERTITSITSIANETSFYVVYRRSDTLSVTVEAESNILPYIETDVRGGALEIKTDRITRCLKPTDQPRIVVTAPFISELVNAGSGDIVAGPLEGDEVQVIVSGSGDIITSTIGCNMANFIISGSGKIKTGTVESDNVKATISGSGSIQTGGNTITARYVISGSGVLYAEDLLTDEANITISGSGSVYTTVLQILDATLSGSGNVYLYGDPDINFTRSGSGRVIKL